MSFGACVYGISNALHDDATCENAAFNAHVMKISVGDMALDQSSKLGIVGGRKRET